MKSPLRPRLVNDPFRAEAMRQVRNECRSYMTRDQSRIGPIRQLIWFFLRYLPRMLRGEFLAWVYLAGGQPVGYGIIRKQGGRYWVTGGVKEAERGLGYGQKIFEDLIRKNRGADTYLDVLGSNYRARALYAKLGFKIVPRHAASPARDILVMVKNA